ncbi:MAG TPA: hypothetical protein VKF81_13510 [Blastocatellia bacterium]|nr:hypothetical protein [Blastocatellia bacterium]
MDSVIERAFAKAIAEHGDLGLAYEVFAAKLYSVMGKPAKRPLANSRANNNRSNGTQEMTASPFLTFAPMICISQPPALVAATAPGSGLRRCMADTSPMSRTQCVQPISKRAI